MAKSNSQIRALFLQEHIKEYVFNDSDFNRHIKETALQLKIPEDVVDRVMKNYFINIAKIIYGKFSGKRRVTVYGFFNIDIKRRSFKNLRKTI